MSNFLSSWQQAAHTSLGLFWMAFWAFALGYLISAMIQVFVTQEKMRKTMGESGPKSVFLGSLFGFLSSSCSFSALSTTRALFAKGAGIVPSLAFMLASTNLVVELGIVIAVFLGWQFVVGEYLGGVLLILSMWLLIRLTRPKKLIDEAQEKARQAGGDDGENSSEKSWKEKITSAEQWQMVANKYVMEWKMVWKDVTVGFTVAGIVASFVPTAFFQSLFIGAGESNNSFFEILAQTLIGPIAAFFTFIGSMGNIPLAAVLFGHGVSFAGVMAFIFSDLVVLPVLRIQAQYYGWKMAFYILIIFLIALVCSALVLHYGFAFFDLLPDPSQQRSVVEREFFKLDYTAMFNFAFILLSTFFLYRFFCERSTSNKGSSSLADKILQGLSYIAFAWLAIGAAALPLLGY